MTRCVDWTPAPRVIRVPAQRRHAAVARLGCPGLPDDVYSCAGNKGQLGHGSGENEQLPRLVVNQHKIIFWPAC